ncbi:MAG: carboxypeptidase regulatory-like domain-containing protein [Flavobacteriales bacterium]|nr:carboxypeptidase regulatory-like domain-containing protein [Flavobacteriales bacterium]
MTILFSSMRHLLLAALALGSVLSTSAQSISGNLNTGSARAALGYGNVDIYKGDDLVASVLTDRFGNFNVSLDTGTYVCVVSYDGYESSTRTVKVRADEKLDLSMVEDASRPAPASRVEKDRTLRNTEVAEESYMPVTGLIGRTLSDREMFAEDDLGMTGPARGRKGPGRGILTAGEVNDFSKWEQWGDLSATVLRSLRQQWSIAPEGRYTLDLQSKSGLPIADAVVHLKGKDGSVLFTARTDNTGKAELWAALDAKAITTSGRMALEVFHHGRLFRVNAAKPFAQGVNRLVLDVPCSSNDNVDVAFVVDATGSMQDELDFLRAEINDIIFRSKRIGDRLNFRFANVFYRDRGSNEVYLTRSMDFSRVLSASVNFISEQSAGGGGDTPEAVEVALDSAINHLSWSSEARTRIIFLVLDASPHPGTEEKMQDLIRNAAAKGIRIVPVAASGIDKGTEYLMRTLALGTNGTYTFLTNHSGVGNSHMEPSTDHYDVESLNDLLVRVLKSYTYMPDCQQQLPELELAYPDSLVLAPSDQQASDSTATGIDGPIDTTATAAIRWSYYPNPTTGLLTIITEVDITELYVTDLSGKLLQVVKDLKANEAMRIDLSAYATGIYLIRYPYGSAWLSGKVILQRS